VFRVHGREASKDFGKLPFVNAVITAGGVVDGDFARRIGTDVKALAPLGETTLLDLAIDAARGAGAQRIAVVGGEAVRKRVASRVDRIIDAAEAGTENAGSENVMRALAAWPSSPLLYLTSDLPFVSADGVRAFVDRSAGYCVTMPLADAHAYERRFPDAPEHVVELGGERVANGNVFCLAPEAIEPVRRWATRFFDARKSKFRMAILLGIPLLLRFASRTLTIEAIERKAGRTLGVPVAAIRDADPGICYDVDTLAEYEYACTRLA
jgi:GTP:adenosylcobinamide-phosphate guanylyltransferase